MRRWWSLLSHVLRGKRLDAVAQTSALPLRSTNEPPTAALLERVSCCHCQAQCLQGQRICFECGGPVKPGQLKSQGPMTTVARGREALLITEAAARQGPRAIDARVSSTSRDVARSQGENGVEEKPPLRATNALLTGSTRIAALMLYPSAMPVTPAVRFVSWAV